MGPVIDKVLGLRCTSYGYQYSEIVGSLSSVYCSSDTILRAISELATGNTTYTSDTGKSYKFNTATKLNSLLVKLNNGFGWARLPKSFMAENTVFPLLTALIRNFYKFLMDRIDAKAFGLKKTSRIKAFVFKFISVPRKMDKDGKALSTEHLHAQQIISEPFCAH